MKKLSLVLLTLVFILALAACGNKTDKEKSSAAGESQQAVKIKSSYQVMGEKEDGSDAKKVTETVAVPKNPKKVAVFDYGALSTIQEFGVEDRVVGLPKGEGNRSLPKFLASFKDDKYTNLGTLKEPNFEKLAEINPELILISGRQANSKVLDEMKKAAPDATILYVGTDDKDYIGSVKENTENLGKIFNKEDKAKQLIHTLDMKIKEVKKLTAASDAKGLFVLANEGELSVFGKGGRFGFIHEVLGVKETDDHIKAEGHGQVINFEYLNDKNPDIIFAMDRGVAVGGKSSSKQALSNEVIKDVNAVKEHKIIELDPYLWYFSSGGAKTTVQQIEEIEKGYK
ncbi:ferrated catecholamine ABC transporter substrate-binding lipoprotein SstD [Macrococcus equipercicus]|uniref:Siderophore ABC transporter substrate-binding protein n=1 Tax=Macrococcus equipercicus TaxID=69967 RepID=A0A9Q9BNA4_9STAP|nr:siderophore ABC transporter substrate-binding protein [Macrococcus equipercicus]UTH13650.1 siderophore ABC transporter substrate-binding protein [Macrococcus equipercicus]